MALTERQEEDKIEIIGAHKQIHVRTATVIERDGVEISRSYHRHVISPGESTINQSNDVKAVAATFHTAARRSSFAAAMAAQDI